MKKVTYILGIALLLLPVHVMAQVAPAPKTADEIRSEIRILIQQLIVILQQELNDLQNTEPVASSSPVVASAPIINQINNLVPTMNSITVDWTLRVNGQPTNGKLEANVGQQIALFAKISGVNESYPSVRVVTNNPDGFQVVGGVPNGQPTTTQDQTFISPLQVGPIVTDTQTVGTYTYTLSVDQQDFVISIEVK